MSFFKDLKDRLFKLDFEPKSKYENSKDKEKNKNIIPRNDKKLNKKIAKTVYKNLKKQKKLNKYIVGLSKSGIFFSQKIKEIQAKHNQINEVFFDELEELLIMSDISVTLVMEILLEVKKEAKILNIKDPKLITEILADKMFISYTNRTTVDTRLNVKNDQINVILVAGVNGSGKTTSIAKIAHLLKQQQQKVLIVAADTFRAGAVQQLEIWSKRVGVDIIKPIKSYMDPSAVVYDGINLAEKNNYDVLIIDTAGRLQNKVNLMKQLQKIKKIITNKIPAAPHESLLVLDATTGQNGISQAKHFKEVLNLTGIVLTKMDGTSKGGIIFTIKDQLDLAVKLISFGEKVEDLQDFDLDAFIYGMTKDLMEKNYVD